MTDTRFLRRVALALVLAAFLNTFLSLPASAQTSPSEYFDFSPPVIGGLTPPPQVSINQTFNVSVTGSVVCKKDLPQWIRDFISTGLISQVAVTGKVTARHTNGSTVELNSGYTVNIYPIPQMSGQRLDINQTVPLRFLAGSPGDYTVTGELISAIAQPFGMDIKTLLVLPGSQSAGSVTLLAPVSTPPPTGSGGGGGGGGGIVSIPQVTPTPSAPLNITVLGQAQTWATREDGSLSQEAKITSPDGKIGVYLKEATYIRDQNANKLTALSINTQTSPPQAPQGYSLVGSAHDLGPNGTRFQPPLELTLAYDDKLLPKNAAEKDLFIAYWDAGSSKWVPLESQVDQTRKVVITKVEHFTLFSIMVKAPLPPAFSISKLVISPVEVKAGEPVTISAEVSNKGESEGKYGAALAIDGIKADSKEITVPALASQRVSFSISRDKPGNYSVSLGEQTGRFIVLPDSPAAAPEPVAAPALFTISELVISPGEAKAGEPVDVSVEVSNKGGTEGKYRAALIIDGIEAETREVTLPALASQKVSFSVSRDKPGSYSVALGELNSAFTVLAPPAPAISDIVVPPPLLVISELVISPKKVKAGERIDISAEISNNGGSEGNFNLTLTIDGVETESKEVTLPALASQKINFGVFRNKPGSYRIALGEQSDLFTVLAPEHLDFSPQQYIILGVAIVLAGAYISWRFHKAKYSV